MADPSSERVSLWRPWPQPGSPCHAAGCRRKIVSALVFSLILAKALPAAGIVALGPERRAPLDRDPPLQWGCKFADGARAEAEMRAGFGDDNATTSTTLGHDAEREMSTVVLNLYGSDGELLADPVIANESGATYNWALLSVTCMADRSVTVTWQRYRYIGSEFVVRVFGPTGMPRTDEILFPRASRHGFNVAATAEISPGELIAVYGANAGLTAVRLNTESGISSAPIVVAEEHARSVAVAVSDDVVGVAWLPSRERSSRVLATIVDTNGAPLATPILVNAHPYGESEALAVDPRSHGRFVVSWANELQGGRVARTIAIDSLGTTTTTTTSTTVPADSPVEFPNLVVLDAFSDERWVHSGGRQLLAADTEGTWVATWRAANRESVDRFVYVDTHASSVDDGRRWSFGAPIRSREVLSWSSDARAAGDGTGEWLQAWRVWTSGDSDYAVMTAHSRDRAATWAAPSIVYEPASAGDLYWGGPAFVEVRAVAPSSWILAVGDSLHYGSPRLDIATVRVLRSGDGAATWNLVAEFPRDTDIAWGSGALAVAGDASLIVWREGDAFKISVSHDGGRTWALPRTLHEDEAVSYGEISHAAGVDAELAGDGTAIVTWQSRGLYGSDDDVVYVRSTDHGRTWSDPKPIAAYAIGDAAHDGDPSIAVDPSGLWLVAWASHYDGGGRWGMDGDILYATSGDGGESWSAPRAVVESARADTGSDLKPRVDASFPGVFGVLWSHEITDASPDDVTIHFATSSVHCGNGDVDSGEICDDGNAVEGDGCDSNCLLSGCGNRIVDTTEECDDGNSDDADDCLSDCSHAFCGDGVVRRGVEECDDGNQLSTDECTATCSAARCGDGVVRAGHEECDDGNADYFDACMPDCTSAVCGDLFVWRGVEQCDDGNQSDNDGCTNDCRLGPGCPATRASPPLASDAQELLRYAVGATATCALATCDVNGDGESTAGDAAMVLQAAVGLIPWPCNVPEIVVRLLSPAELGALQVRIDYAGAFPTIAQRGDGRPDCDFAGADGGLAAANDIGGTLMVAVVSSDGFFGPADIVACRVAGRIGDTGSIDVAVDDSSGPDFQPVGPLEFIVFDR